MSRLVFSALSSPSLVEVVARRIVGDGLTAAGQQPKKRPSQAERELRRRRWDNDGDESTLSREVVIDDRLACRIRL